MFVGLKLKKTTAYLEKTHTRIFENKSKEKTIYSKLFD